MSTSTLPSSFTLLIGPPRSGTTLIANTFMSHSQVSGVMEPFQRRRKQAESSSTTAEFLAENANDLDAMAQRPNLVVKETTTRLANVEASLELTTNFASQGVYTGLVIILRCPFSAFLSQVEASKHMWGEKKLTVANSETFNSWMSGQVRSLRFLTNHARAQHYRLISYEAFCQNPKTEMARLMALVPLRLEESQFSFSAPSNVQPGGDPKTQDKAGRIEVTDRNAKVADLISEIERGPGLNFAEALQELVLDRICSEPDEVVLDRISRLCMTER